MAARFWVGGSGNISDTAHWSTTSGGSGGSAVPTSSDTVTFDLMSNATAYTITMNATLTCSDLTVGAPTIGAVTFSGSGDFTIYGNTSIVGSTVMSGATGTMTFRATSGTKTISTNGTQLGSSIVFNGTGGTFQLTSAVVTSGAVWSRTNGVFSANSQSVTYNGADCTISGSACTFHNLTYTGTAALVNTLSFGVGTTVSGTLAVTGNSKINRVLIAASNIGSAITLTCATATMNAVDLRDITLAGAASGNLSGVSNYSGDCGGNTGWTFTTATAQTWSGTSGGNWSANAWTSRVPLPQDDVTINSAFAASQTITSDMPRLGKSITWANTGNSVIWSKPNASSIYGSLTMTGTGLMSQSGTAAITFEGRSAYTITSSGQSLGNSIVQWAPGGTITPQDALTITSLYVIVLGTFNGNGFDHSASNWSFASSASVVVTLGTGTYTATGTGTVWSMGASTTFSGADATLLISNTSSATKTLAGASKTYGALRVVSGTGYIALTGDNSWVSIQNNSTSGSAFFKFPASNSQTITGGASAFSANALGGTINIISSIPGTQYNVSSATKLVCSYLTLKDCNGVGSGVIPHVVASNATDAGNNANWAFPRLAAIALAVSPVATAEVATASTAVVQSAIVFKTTTAAASTTAINSVQATTLKAITPAEVAEATASTYQETALFGTLASDVLSTATSSALATLVGSTTTSDALLNASAASQVSTVADTTVAVSTANGITSTLGCMVASTSPETAVQVSVSSAQTLTIQNVSQETDAAVAGATDLAADVALAVSPVSTSVASTVSGVGVFTVNVGPVSPTGSGAAGVASAFAAATGSAVAPQAAAAIAGVNVSAVVGSESTATNAVCLISADLASRSTSVEQAVAAANIASASLANQLALCRIEVVISNAIAAMQDLQWDEVLVSLTPHYLTSPVPRSLLIGTSRRRVSVAGSSLLLYSLPGTGVKRLTVAGTSLLLSTLEGAGDRRLTLKGQARVN